VTSYEAKIEWFGTVRGRLGFLINNQVLVYATGGLAYGKVGVSGNSIVNGSVIGPSFTAPFNAAGATAFNESRTNIGWTVGTGIEGRFAYWLPASWTWKLEYLYLDLGSLDTTNPFPPAQAAYFTTLFTGPFTTHTHFTDNIVRVGLNYQFH